MKKICFLGVMLALLLTNCQKSKEEIFARDAHELTKQCPVAVDPNTYLDSLVYDEKNASFQYCYSLQGFTDEQLKELIASHHFTQNIKNNVLNSVEMKPYKDAGLTFVYRYYSRQSHLLLGCIEVTPEEYR